MDLRYGNRAVNGCFQNGALPDGAPTETVQLAPANHTPVRAYGAMRQSVYEITSAKHPEMDAHLRFYRNVTGLGIYAMPLLGSNPPMATIVAAGNVAGQQLIITLPEPNAA